jgi:ABC-type Fe3+ transport system permease subunit
MSTVFLFKLTLILLLLFIIFNLAKALVEMVREDPDNPDRDHKPMSHYLGRRVMFSALVVILLLIALTSGWIDPNPRPY